jgi:hypothetical protein
MSLGAEEFACSHPCGGACCRSFVIHGLSPEARAQKVEEIRTYAAAGGELDPWMTDYLTVHEMLVEEGVNPEGR